MFDEDYLDTMSSDSAEDQLENSEEIQEESNGESQKTFIDVVFQMWEQRLGSV